MSEGASEGVGYYLDELHDFSELNIVPFLCVRHA